MCALIAPGIYPLNLAVSCLCQPPGVPVCSPEFIPTAPAISQSKDLHQYPILREESWDGWDEWFAKAGFEKTPDITGPRLENAYMTLKAAEDGQGIALGPVALMNE